MNYFNNVQSIREATLIYRRLALLNHPDMGGSEDVMRNINMEYNLLKERLRNLDKDFDDIEVFDKIVVNGSPSTIISISNNTFIVKSDLTGRKAVFCRKTGRCLSNPKFTASRIKSYLDVR